MPLRLAMTAASKVFRQFSQMKHCRFSDQPTVIFLWQQWQGTAGSWIGFEIPRSSSPHNLSSMGIFSIVRLFPLTDHIIIPIPDHIYKI